MSPCFSLSHSNSQALKGTGRVNSSAWFLLGAWDSAGKCILKDLWVLLAGDAAVPSLCLAHPICVHSKPKGAAPSSRRKILGVVMPTCKAPGEPGGFSSAFPAGILLEGGRGSPWVCLRRVVPFTRCPSASLATPGARGCSRQASSHP